jgi:hypothetical protein
MPRALALLSLVLAAACGKVSRGEDGGAGGPGGDGGGVVADAAAPDATPVACDGPEDCMSPDDPCLLPGPCTDSVCHFQAMDCSDLDGECAIGVCREGQCLAKPVHEGLGCGDGVMACGAFGSCGGFADVCDESGTQSRSCTDSTCQAGTCVTGAAYSDTRACSRTTTGTTCADTTYDCDGVCNYTSVCDRDDTDVTCVTTDYSCSGGSCSPSETVEVDDCQRDTEGLPCGASGCCSATGTCVAECV